MEDGAFVPFVVSMGENERSFADRGRTLEEVKSLFFNILYLLLAAYVSPVVISSHNFLVHFNTLYL